MSLGDSPPHVQAQVQRILDAEAPVGAGDRLLTARVVAERLGVCTETILRWVRRGELPAIRLPGGALRIPKPMLDEWLVARATPVRGALTTTTDAAGRDAIGLAALRPSTDVRAGPPKVRSMVLTTTIEDEE